MVLIPGDPDRAERIAATWDSARPLHDHRGFRSFVGELSGAPIGVISSGIGGPSVAIAVEELARVGVTTFLRVGSSGAIDRSLRGGDLVITTAAARFEGTSRAYAPIGYPAVAHPEVVRALEDAARDLGVRARSGLTATVDTFHPSQERTGFRALPPSPDRFSRPTLRRLGILNLEMEASTLLTVASVFRLRAGAVCAVYPEGRKGDPEPRGDSAAIAVANEAARRLARASPTA